MKAIDFFCGGGGMTYGLRQAGINVIAGVDFDVDAEATLQPINANDPRHKGDVSSLPYSHCI